MPKIVRGLTRLALVAVPEKMPTFAADTYAKVARIASADFYMRTAQEVAGKMNAGRLLDVGTGPGYLPTHIALRAPKIQIVGIDLSRKMVELARRHSDEQGVSRSVRFEPGNAGAMRFTDGSFDMVISTRALHYWKNPMKVLNEIHRVLKPGGEAWIYDLCRDAPGLEIKEYEANIRKWMKAAGIGRFSRAWTYLMTRREIKVDSYSVGELTSIATASRFHEYDVRRQGVWMRAVLRKEK
jgi:ubiquinone/menaquinone biosynthesis C-methylase UbiE